MEELIRRVSERAGISDEQSRCAVDTVVAYLREKLPEPFASQLNGQLGASAENGEAVELMVGHMFAGCKE
jgi:hypothetical protein